MKSVVDDAIDQCAEVFNLRDSVEVSRVRAEQANDEQQKRQYAHRGKYAIIHLYKQCLTSLVSTGLQNLRRYFELIVFQSYLQSTEPDTMNTFESLESFVRSRPGQ